MRVFVGAERLLLAKFAAEFRVEVLGTSCPTENSPGISKLTRFLERLAKLEQLVGLVLFSSQHLRRLLDTMLGRRHLSLRGRRSVCQPPTRRAPVGLL